MSPRSLIIFIHIIAISLFCGMTSGLQSEEGKAVRQIIAQVNESGKGEDGLASELKKNKKLQLTVQRVVEYLLRNNYDVKKALLEYKGSSAELLSFQGKFDPVLVAGGGYQHGNYFNQMSGSTLKSDTITYSGGISKSFTTGTTLSAKITGITQKMPNPLYDAYGVSGDMYQTNISVSLKQEILKNCFGINDRATETQLKNLTFIKRQTVRFKLASLLVDAIVAYWNVAIAEEYVKTTDINLKKTIEVRNLIQRKMRLGLSEAEDIYEWNGKVLQAQNANESAKKTLFDAKLAILRTLNLDSDVDNIEIGTTLQTTPPSITFEQAIKDAYLKRIDWNIQKVVVKNTELEYKAAYNNLLPSLSVNMGVGNNAYDRDSYADTLKKYSGEYSVGLEFAYPLGNSAGEVRMRNARLGIQKENVNLLSLEKEIKDQVLSIVKQCELDYTIYTQTKKAHDYARRYYFEVFRKFNLGRQDMVKYTSTGIKLALEAYINARFAELKSLVDYNISLIRRDLARNMIFEDLKIDVDGILKRLDD